ncbi:MAG: hypothetical protein KF886_21610 [Candidatus Hydrogenedentes bacterium]|nr:hypothetical protein [Candidatus Hydrogenedentota bacterium]
MRHPTVRFWALALFILLPAAGAQELTPREKEMLDLIEALKERVTALEETVERLEAAPTAPPETPTDTPAKSQPTTAPAPEPAAPNDLRVYWDSGLNFESRDGQFELSIGGRLHHDWYWFDHRHGRFALPDQEDGTDFRRARIDISGTLYENLSFEFDLDFEDGDASFKDVFLELNHLPLVQNLRAGHFREPFSLNELESSNDITFMERALPNVLAPSRNAGVMLHGAWLGEPGKARLTGAAGIFRATDDFGFDASDGGYSGTVRVTGLPWYAADGRRLIHLGAAYTHRNPEGLLQLAQAPESGGADDLLDTGEFNADRVRATALEAALVYGPLSLQGEYLWSDIDANRPGDGNVDGYYLQASYLLTGEHRAYKHGAGVLGGITPHRNFRLHGQNRGWGAFELALRYSHLDLNASRTDLWSRVWYGDTAIRGGEASNLTLGLNWYLNPDTRVMLNWVRSDIERGIRDEELDILQTRFQIGF